MNVREKLKLIMEKFKGIKPTSASAPGADAMVEAAELVESPQQDNPKLLRRKQLAYLSLGLLVLIAGILLLVQIKLPSAGGKGNSIKSPGARGQEENNYKLQLATDSVKAKKKWQEYLEEKIDQEQEARSKQLGQLKEVMNVTEETIKTEQKQEFAEIKERLSFALRSIDLLKASNDELRGEVEALSKLEEVQELPADLALTNIIETEEISLPESSWDYIPATAFVNGYLMGGIAVSTSVNSANAPIPVVIRLAERGNLPKDFAVGIKQCRLLASAYGDVSSERAIIRAEELVCEDKRHGLVTTTKVAGVIYGDDGMNGIRGSVVSMSEKHLKNAFVSGVLSGFASSVRGNDSLNVSALGVINTQKKGAGEMAEQGLAKGAATASEKLADYHIKLAENISPVILIPGGTKVDVMFTKGVHIGARSLKEQLDKARKKQNQAVSQQGSN